MYEPLELDYQAPILTSLRHVDLPSKLAIPASTGSLFCKSDSKGATTTGFPFTAILYAAYPHYCPEPAV